jgi:imidazolonepropionase
MTDAVVYGAAELVIGPGEDATLRRMEDAGVAIEDGRVASLGPTDAVVRDHPPENADVAVDATGKTVLPGFVDAHTHALFVGDRSDEFAAKLRGKSYQEMLAEGGGILRTVRAVREASDETHRVHLREQYDAMLAAGTTTVEVKSGYGLDPETELRMLEAIDRVGDDHPIDVVPTFMGGHAVPDEMTPEAYVDRVIDEQLPAVEQQGIAEFCDVFCEEDVFSVEQSRRILEAGRERGLTPKVHAEEFSRLGGSRLAAELGAASADHLLEATVEDVESLAQAGVTPVALPATGFGLGGTYAPMNRFREAGVMPAVATDFNPNCHARTLGFAATLACVGMGATPAEAVAGITEGGARALDRADDRGSLEEGAVGDLVVLDAPSHVHLPYQYDIDLVETVLRSGRRVVG